MSERIDTNRIAIHPVLGEDVRRATVQVLLDGNPLPAREGESIATTLRAHGIVVNRTMPDSASPRGYFCGVGRCPDCIMTVDGVLNVRTCTTTIRDSMVIETQQGFGTWKVRT